MAWGRRKKSNNCAGCGQWAGPGHRCPSPRQFEAAATFDGDTVARYRVSGGGNGFDGYDDIVSDRVDRANEAIKDKEAYKPMDPLDLVRWADANGNNMERRNSPNWEMTVRDTNGYMWTGHSLHVARYGFADERGPGNTVLLLTNNGHKRFALDEVSAADWRPRDPYQP